MYMYADLCMLMHADYIFDACISLAIDSVSELAVKIVI